MFWYAVRATETSTIGMEAVTWRAGAPGGGIIFSEPRLRWYGIATWSQVEKLTGVSFPLKIIIFFLYLFEKLVEFPIMRSMDVMSEL